MSAFPGSPRIIKGGLVLLDRDSGAVQRVISLQYNPDTLNRSLQMQGAGEGGDRLEALRLKGPPVETINLEAVIDATDQLEYPDNNPQTVATGVAHQLAALESLLYPSSTTLAEQNALAAQGRLEILSATQPLILFVWGQSRIVPVRITEFGIVEEAFDTALNPIRAKVTMGLRVLSINDLSYDSTGGGLYRVYQQEKERLSRAYSGGALSDLGIGGLQ
jgi:Contractile injection system tube protein